MSSLARGQLLFVYGTLRRGFSHPLAQRLAQTAEYMGEASVQSQLYWVTEDYPGMVPSKEEAHSVVGDLYSLSDPSLLEVLDQYEGAAYERRRLPVNSGMGPAAAWVYVYQGAITPELKIEGGDFLLAARKRERLTESAVAGAEVDHA
jgi:gamma-glutamylcyclotransferase (GGCT)/AIG2-like uncharacterized protein YtfP